MNTSPKCGTCGDEVRIRESLNGLKYHYCACSTDPPQKGKILSEAKKIINGKRQDEYGEPEDSFYGIARRWSHYIEMRHGVSCHLTEVDVAHMMAELKMERELHSYKRDNLIDACGYLAIKADLMGEE